MRMNAKPRRRRGSRISLSRILAWAFGAVVLCGVMSAAGTSDLVQTIPGVWVPGAALSLTLITAVMGSQK
jgi:hypothetical protein